MPFEKREVYCLAMTQNVSEAIAIIFANAFDDSYYDD